MSGRPTARSEHGQVIVIMAVALVVVILLVGLAIDGGNAWSQQRDIQNGSDAAAQAGATVLAQKLGGMAEPGGGWDLAVLNAVNGIAAANGDTPPVAYYTDICGLLLTATGGAATGTGDAARVGGGFPTSAAITPDCPNRIPGPVAGVSVDGSKDFSTYFASVAGIPRMTARAHATAVTGFVESCQDTEQGCSVLPLTAPVWKTICTGPSLKDLNPLTGTPWPRDTTVVVPFCQNTAGNSGWLDWDPPAGGASEIAGSIRNPDNPAVDLPSWQYVAQTGAVDSSDVESALREYIGQVVLFPLFDHTCVKDGPDESQVTTTPYYGCAPGNLDTDPNAGAGGGGGSTAWYRLPQFAAFLLEGAYTNGNNRDACQNVGTQCIVGKFVKFVVSGQVGPGTGGGSTGSSVIGVQLIE